jgi:hypothetical protein
MEVIKMKKGVLLVLGLMIVCLSLAVTSFAADEPKEIGKEEHWVAYDDGTVVDTKLGLMWPSESSKTMKWADAKAYCDNYAGSGFTDWRLPTGKELESLYDVWLKPTVGKFKWGSYYLTKYIQLQQCCPWTTDKKARDPKDTNRKVFDFGRGVPYFAEKFGDVQSPALCVRNIEK